MDSVLSRFTDESSSNRSEESCLRNGNLLKSYLNQIEKLDNESSLQEVPEQIRNFFIPYVKHIRLIDNTFYFLNKLLEVNESLSTNGILLDKFRNITQTLKNDMNKLTDDLINQLVTNNPTNVTRITQGFEYQNAFNDFCDDSDSIEESQLSKVVDLVSNHKNLSNKRKQESGESNKKKSKIEQNSELQCAPFVNTQDNQESDPLRKNLKFDRKGSLLVYVDGSCLLNGRYGAQAGFGVWFNYNHSLNVSAPVKGVPTNNNAEIQAATKAILQANSIGIKKIRILTDSQFLINCMTKWIQKWKKNKWMTAAKQPVKNKESLTELDSVIPLMERVEWEYVEGHKGIAGNEEADALAKNGAALYKI